MKNQKIKDSDRIERYFQGFIDGADFQKDQNTEKIDKWNKERLSIKNINRSDEEDIQELRRFLNGEYDNTD